MFKIFEKIKNLIGGLGVLHVLIYFFSIMQSVITVYFAVTVKDLINSATNFQGVNDLIIKSVICVLTVVISYALSILVKLISEKLKIQTEINFKKLVFKGYTQSDYLKQTQIKSGKLLSVINNDTVLLASGYVTLLPAIFSTITKLITTIVVLYLLQPIFTLIIIGVGLTVILITFLIRKVSAKLYKNTLKQDGECLSFINDNIDNTLIVKANRAENVVVEINDQKLQGYEKAKKKQKYFNQIISDATGLMFMGFYVVTLVWCVFGIANGVSGVDYGVLTAMLQLVMQIRSPFAFLGNAVTTYYEMKVSFNRIESFLNNKEDVKYQKID
ncbi:MAG: ABC transporter ATP-binding protein [Clostridia bacterium]|nr:ABC transporter ATP-binding protein [Clostridia bacterium]